MSDMTFALNNICKSFAGFKALNQVDFAAKVGEVHALLGENGAGKSTLMNIACGLYAPDEGYISISGTKVLVKDSRTAIGFGIGMVHQHFKLVPAFTVLENILLFNSDRSAKHVSDKAHDIARQMGFELDLKRRTGDLGVAEQQRIEILKVLTAGAKFIILDEPTAVLSDQEALSLMHMVRDLAKNGHAIILVTHKLNEALSYSDHITILRNGEKIAETKPDQMDATKLTNLIVGQSIAQISTFSSCKGAKLLDVTGLKSAETHERRCVNGVDFNVRQGEIYGIAGVAGNGQTELAEILMGVAPSASGTIVLENVGDISNQSPRARRSVGFATIPVDRYKYGLSGRRTLSENYAINGALSGQYGSWLWFDRKKAHQATTKAIQAFDVQGARGTRMRAGLLSGGNAQKLVIAREFQDEPKVILAHSPSRGLDVRAGAAVHRRLQEARDKGAAVIVISEDLDEIFLLSDRIGVLSNGRMVAEFDAPAERAEVGKAMVSAHA